MLSVWGGCTKKNVAQSKEMDFSNFTRIPTNNNNSDRGCTVSQESSRSRFRSFRFKKALQVMAEEKKTTTSDDLNFSSSKQSLGQLREMMLNKAKKKEQLASYKERVSVVEGLGQKHSRGVYT